MEIKRKAIFLIILAGLPISDVQAHGFAIYVSTPVSPPSGYGIVSVITLLALVFLNIILFKSLRLANWKQSIRTSVLGILLFTIFFYVFGFSCTLLSTAPPPGLGLGHPVFEGFGWSTVGGLFVGWNIFGVVVLLLSIVLSSKLWNRRRERKVCAILFANICFYLFSLIPYVANGALTHGWAGGHVRTMCDWRIKSIATALCKYSRENNNRFPAANTFDELLSVLTPYMEKTYSFPIVSRRPISMCPLGSALEKNPKKYVWNAKLAGEKLDMDELSEPNQVPIVCPYHGASRWSLKTLMKLEEMQEQ